MLFVSDANILKYFRAIKSIDFYKHFISIDHLSFIFLHFLLWPQNIKEIPVPTQWLFLTSKNPLKLPTADKVPKSIYVILINIRYKQEANTIILLRGESLYWDVVSEDEKEMRTQEYNQKEYRDWKRGQWKGI